MGIHHFPISFKLCTQDDYRSTTMLCYKKKVAAMDSAAANYY
jgi:hypothetical protein